jgi:hypothetical protein
MAHDPHATAWIKTLKEGIKHFKDLDQQYHDKFITHDGVPTAADIKNFTTLMAQAEAAKKLMYGDLQEAEQALMTFGGPSDTFFPNMKNKLAVMKKKVKKS